jgi:hypothetical protein
MIVRGTIRTAAFVVRSVLMSFQQSATLPTAATTATTAGTSAAAASLPSLSDAFASLGTNPHVVGAAWMVSSAIFTTYSTTRFLKYPVEDSERLRRKLHQTALPLQRHISRFLALPPASMLTLWRFLGSLLLGLVLHLNLNIAERFRSTLAAVPDLAVPAVFLFVANLANS